MAPDLLMLLKRVIISINERQEFKEKKKKKYFFFCNNFLQQHITSNTYNISLIKHLYSTKLFIHYKKHSCSKKDLFEIVLNF